MNKRSIRGNIAKQIIIKKRLILLPFSQHITKLIQGTPDELRLLPQVRGEEAVGVGDGDEGGFEGVFEGLGGAGGGGVDVLDTSELEEALDGGGGDEAGTAGSGDQLFIY